jgi:hypothetical protein
MKTRNIGSLTRGVSSTLLGPRRFQIFCLAIVSAGVGVLFGGIWLSLAHHKPDNINRSGGLITALSLSIGVAQFHFERKNRRYHERQEVLVRALAAARQYPPAFVNAATEKARNYAEDRFEDFRYRLLILTIGMGAIGEIIHAIGDVFFCWLLSFYWK